MSRFLDRLLLVARYFNVRGADVRTLSTYLRLWRHLLEGDTADRRGRAAFTGVALGYPLTVRPRPHCSYSRETKGNFG